MPKTILIVEDDSDLREALAQVLGEEGYQVASAAHGLEALQSLRQGGLRPCVILLDLTMPVMNGWQFRAEQRNDPSLSAIPVVILSAAHNIADEMPGLGVRDYLRKPIQLGALIETIAQLCG